MASTGFQGCSLTGGFRFDSISRTLIGRDLLSVALMSELFDGSRWQCPV